MLARVEVQVASDDPDIPGEAQASAWVTGKFLSVDGGLVDLPAGMPPEAYRELTWKGGG